MTAQGLKNSILQLAVQGKLVPQCKDDEPASELLKRIEQEKSTLIKAGKINKYKALAKLTADDYPFDIPESWVWIKLGDVCQLHDGVKKSGEKYPYLEAKYLRGKIDATMLNEGKFVKKGTRLILVDGENSGEVFNATEDGYMGSTFKVLYFPQQFFEGYVLYFLLFKKEAFRHNKTGSAIPHLNKELFFNTPFPIPPLAEQKRIAEKIEELMPLIEEYGKAEEQLSKLNAEFPDKLRKSILQQAVQGKLTERDPADEPASVLLKRIRSERSALQKSKVAKKSQASNSIDIDEIPFDIPDVWEWVHLGWICQKIGAGSTPKGGSVAYVSEGIKFIREQNVHNDGLHLDGVVYIDEMTHTAKAGSQVQPRDILMNITGASIGRNALVPDDFDTANINQHVLILRLIDKELRQYLHYCLSAPVVLNQMFIKQVGDKPGLSATKVENFLIPLPPLAEQKRIVKRVEELLALCDELK